MPGRKIDHTNTKCRICGSDKTGRINSIQKTARNFGIGL